ncbi:MAG: hypothetical protein HOW73_34250 [Polyangiaceae bacterium]|nr:hypothetical protein [Polyangiaceae bacterium]
MRKAVVRSVAALAFIAPLTVLIAACGKSPEAVCKRFDELSKDDKDKQSIDDCKKEMEEIKKASPKGFDCIAKCSDLSSGEAAGLCMFGCVGTDKALEEVLEKSSKEKQEKRDKEEAEKMVGWSKKADKAFEGALKDFSDKETKYSITLVEGFKEDAAGGGFMKGYEFDAGEKSFGGPHITVTSGSSEEPAKALEDAVSTAGITKDKVVKKESNDTGYLLHTEGEFGIGVETMTKAGESNLKCSARMSSSAAVQKKDELFPWLEKMCKSLKAK